MGILLFHFNLIPILLLFFILFTVVRKRKAKNQRLLPPGPWKLPLIGSLHHLIGALPHHALRNLSRKYGPLMHLQLGEVDSVIVSSPHMAKEILKVHDPSFAARPELMVSSIVFYRQKDIVFAKMVIIGNKCAKYASQSYSVQRWSSRLVQFDKMRFMILLHPFVPRQMMWLT